ncbi:MAG: PA14 domain-containing protein, partial [Betaproteobacteria bacterium]
PIGVNYSSAAISEDGDTIVATVAGGGVVSSNDGGTTWQTTQTIALQGSPFLGGSATVELYENIGGSRVSDLTFSNSGFSLPATRLAEMSGAFDYSGRSDSYGDRISGWITPPETGNYQLWIAGDDSAELWLDASGTGEGALARIASVDAPVGRGNWTQTPGQRSASVMLEKGKLYRFEVLHKEGFGGDFVQVGYSKAGSTAVQVIPGSWLVAGQTPDQLTVTLSVPMGGVGEISGDTVAGVAVTVGGTATQRTFTGSLPALHTYFTQPGNIRFSGEARTLDVRVGAASDAIEPVTLAPMLPSGAVTVETWSGIAGTTLSALRNSANFPNNSNSVREIALSPVDANGNGGFSVNPGGDNYGARIRGYLAPSETGAVNLFLTGDDSAELWVDLSGDGTGALTRVASLDSATGASEWTKFASQKSANLNFERGRLYRFEILLKEGAGSDFVRVGYAKAGTTAVSAVPSHWVLPDLPASLTLTLTAPAGGVVVLGGSNAAGGQANSPSSEGPLNVLDGDSSSKYFNRDKLNTGLVFAYPQAQVVDTLRLVSANDAPERDPITFVLYGSNESAEWAGSDWVEIASGGTGLASARRVASDVAIESDTAYRFYKLVFPTLRDAARASGMQVAEVMLFGEGSALAAKPYGSVSTQPAAGITVSGDSISRSLTGNVYALHRYLNTVGNVQFTGVGTQLQVRVAGSQALTAVPVTTSLATGTVTLEVWNTLSGTAVSALTGSPLYPNRSSSVSEVAVSGDGLLIDKLGDNYGARVSGYFAPTESGSFNLFMTADDSAELWLDVSGTGQGSLTRVAQVTGAVGTNEWTRTPVQRSANISLEKGKLYRFEALLKEGSGGDFIRIGYARVGTTAIQPVPASWYVADTPSLVTVTLSAPAGGVVVSGGSNAAGAVANSPVNESAQNAADGRTGTKYLNFDGPGSGLVFSAPQSVSVDELRLVTRTNDDNWQWDPKAWQLWGSNASSDWNAQGWTLIDEGSTGLGNERGASSTVAVENQASFRHYKLVFTEVKGESADGKRYLHLSEATLLSAGRSIAAIPYGVVQLAALPAGIAASGTEATRVLTGSIHALQGFLGTAGNVTALTNGQQLDIRVSAEAPAPRTAPIGSTPLAGEPIAAGGFRVERWLDIGGTRVSDLTGNARYGGAPSSIERVSGKLELSPNRDNYGERLSGWITPPESGSYRLWVTADDSAELWVDTSGTGSGALTRVAFLDGAAGQGNWTRNASQRSAAITLERGRSYRFELLHKEGSGGDFVQVGVSRASEAAPQVLPANWLGSAPEQLSVSFAVVGSAGGSVIAKAADSITIGGTDTARTVTGSWAALSAYLAQADAIRYSGAATSLTMTTASVMSGRVLETRSIFVGAGKLAVDRASAVPLGAGRLDVDKAYTINFARPSIDLNLQSTLTLGDNYSASAVIAGNRLLVADAASRETYFYNRNDQGTRDTDTQVRVLEKGAIDWSAQAGAPALNWRDIATDAGGTRLVAAAGAAGNGTAGNRVYTALVAQSGAITWTEAMNGLPANANWVSVDSDATGRVLVAAAQGGHVYIADTSQVDWAWRQVSTATADWTAVSLSGDGKVMAAAASGKSRGLWVVTDSGAKWRPVDYLGVAVQSIDWTAAELDTSGETLFAAGQNNRLYAMPITPTNAAPSLMVPETLGA